MFTRASHGNRGINGHYGWAPCVWRVDGHVMEQILPWGNILVIGEYILATPTGVGYIYVKDN